MRNSCSLGRKHLNQLNLFIPEILPSRFDMLKYVEEHKLPSLYTVDAKLKGNIGRFFNHSCQPNIKTHHIYVDTHDFRLPWIAFFTERTIAAGSVSFNLFTFIYMSQFMNRF